MEQAPELLDHVQRAKRGDRDAFAGLYADLGRPLFLYLAGLLRRREDAEDALQTAFLRAWIALPGLERPDRVRPWMFRIAKNVARDMGRRLARRATEDAGEDLLSPAAPAAPAADDEPGGDEEILGLVAGLRPETRALVLLRAVHGWSAEETAEALQWSVATVRRRYARALALLRERIEGSVTHDPRR